MMGPCRTRRRAGQHGGCRQQAQYTLQGALPGGMCRAPGVQPHAAPCCCLQCSALTHLTSDLACAGCGDCAAKAGCSWCEATCTCLPATVDGQLSSAQCPAFSLRPPFAYSAEECKDLTASSPAPCDSNSGLRVLATAVMHSNGSIELQGAGVDSLVRHVTGCLVSSSCLAGLLQCVS